MDLNGVHYDAFISYRHCPLDMYIAKSIHKRLENFKLPKAIAQKVEAKGKKTKIERVFRDQDELPLADNLSDPIDVALGNSDYLIVICTPRLPQSQWCRKEITTFIRKHDRDHILVVLAEGEPYESFPYELTHEEITITNPDGSTSTQVRELEPLAADVRGKNKHETEKMLDDAAVRLCAGIFELNYDDLKQRHKEQQTKKRVRILGGIAAAMFAFSMVCLGLLLTINSQKRTIDTQYEEIQSQYTQIQDQYVQIEEQYDEIQDKYEDAMGNAAEKLLDEGRRNDALYALLHAIEGKECKSGTEYLLSKALNVYGMGALRAPTTTYDMDANVEEMVLNNEGTRIALKATSGEMVVFDTETGKRVYAAKTMDESYTYSSFEQEAFASENVIYYIDHGKLCYCDIESKKGDYLLEEAEVVFSNQQIGMAFAFDQGILYAFDDAGTQLYSIDISIFGDDFYAFMAFLDDYEFSPDKTKLAIESWYGGGNNVYIIIDVKTGEVISHFFGASDGLIETALTNDTIYLMKTDLTFTTQNGLHNIVAYDIYTLEPLWNITVSGKFYTKMKADQGVLFVYSTSSGLLIDATTGQMLNSWEDIQNIVNASVLSTGSVMVVLGDGGVYILRADVVDYLDMTSSIYSYAPTNKVLDFAMRKENAYIMFSGEKYVSKYAPGHCETEYPDFVVPEEYLDYSHTFGTQVKLNDGVSKSAYVSPDGKYTFAGQYDGSVIVYDQDNNIISDIYDFNSELTDVLYIEKLDRYVLNSYSRSFVLDENLKIVGKLSSCYDYEDGNFIVYESNEWYKIPYYDTDALINKAKETLGDYVPSDEISTKYGIKIEN